MRRSGLWLGLSVMLFTAMLGCDTSTDLSEVTVQGNWEGVGAIEAAFSETRVSLTEASDGTVAGSWRRQGLTGSVTGTNENGNLELRFSGFTTGTAIFEGRFRDGFTMEGTLSGVTLDGNAVFRRKNFGN